MCFERSSTCDQEAKANGDATFHESKVIIGRKHEIISI
jgi:hypothetical protein